MKKILFVLFLFLLASCIVIAKREKQDQLYPGKALLRGKSNCNITPKPIFKN